MATKTCKKCRQKKDLSMFYIHKQMSDGHLSFCKSCVKKRVYKRFINKHDKIQEYEHLRSKTEHRKKMLNIYKLKRIELYPNKEKARRKTTSAIRDGRLKRLPCEICGEIKSEVHHLDYRSPFKIRWLCRKHHRQLHNPMPF